MATLTAESGPKKRMVPMLLLTLVRSVIQQGISPSGSSAAPMVPSPLSSASG